MHGVLCPTAMLFCRHDGGCDPEAQRQLQQTSISFSRSMVYQVRLVHHAAFFSFLSWASFQLHFDESGFLLCHGARQRLVRLIRMFCSQHVRFSLFRTDCHCRCQVHGSEVDSVSLEQQRAAARRRLSLPHDALMHHRHLQVAAQTQNRQPYGHGECLCVEIGRKTGACSFSGSLLCAERIPKLSFSFFWE